VVLSCLSALTLRRVYNRLHFLTPATSLGAPLIGLAVAVYNGWGLTTAEVLFIVFLLAVTGPVLEAATGRVAAQREGLLKRESPE
jgi:multicomponent Na+:H+ antiporter subunit G